GEVEVPVPDYGLLTGFRKLLRCELANGLQHPVAVLFLPRLVEHQGLVGQTGEEIENFVRLYGCVAVWVYGCGGIGFYTHTACTHFVGTRPYSHTVCAHRLRRSQGPSAREHGEAA